MTDDEIYIKYRDELIRYATVLVGASNAEDVLSSVITRLYRSRRGLSTIDAPRPYLMRAVLNESINRRKVPVHYDVGEVAVQQDRSDPEVLDAVMSLPTRQRAATYLTYWCELTSDEVAALMGCRPGTVRRYVHLAKQKLSEVLDHGE